MTTILPLWQSSSYKHSNRPDQEMLKMSHDSGFTLLECLFAMAIFSVAMLGVIGLQLNAIITDGETWRQDKASQLLTAGAERVAFSDYDSPVLYSGCETGIIDFIQGVKEKTVTDPLMSWRGGQVSLYLCSEVSSGIPHIRRVCLVAAWDSVKRGERKILCRLVVKPQNILQ